MRWPRPSNAITCKKWTRPGSAFVCINCKMWTRPAHHSICNQLQKVDANLILNFSIKSTQVRVT